MKQPNVCFIVIDALRARNIGCYGYGKLTTPHIDDIAKEGVTFDNCFCCINTTDPSFTTILSGKYPASHGLVTHGETEENLYLKKTSRLKFLQSIFRSKGYVTIAVDWLGRWHKNGFEHYSGRLDKKGKFYEWLRKTKIGGLVYNFGFLVDKKLRPGHIISYDDASHVTTHALEMVKKYEAEIFFLFIHYWDPHAPYNPPQEYLRKFQDEEYTIKVESIDQILNSIADGQWKRFMEKWTKNAQNVNDILARYDAEINYVDSQIGRLVERMRALGTYDDTVFVITSDHGESLTEHGIYFDHHGLYDVSIHVPLIIRYPEKISKEKRISALVQHVDLAPTILDLADLDCSKHDYDGKSLIPLLERDVKDFRSFVYAEEAHTQRKFSIRTGMFKYILAPSRDRAVCNYCNRIHGDLEELYDLQNDPDENFNIANRTEIKLKLRSKLTDFIEGLKAKGNEKQRLKRRIKNLKIREKTRLA